MAVAVYDRVKKFDKIMVGKRGNQVYYHNKNAKGILIPLEDIDMGSLEVHETYLVGLFAGGMFRTHDGVTRTFPIKITSEMSYVASYDSKIIEDASERIQCRIRVHNNNLDVLTETSMIMMPKKGKYGTRKCLNNSEVCNEIRGAFKEYPNGFCMGMNVFLNELATSPEATIHDEECAICLDPILKRAKLYPCKHKDFCRTCIAKVMNGDSSTHPVCPICRESILIVRHIRSG
jgi:hypothetical protein